ncbi:MAG: patatin-like phospholipase family protein [Anaerolineaceae bacterium]|nr:patatin-like phospholipase family protein [Anaerolineaceae bacterium]
METCTAFVLGGGGSRGALQVGAIRALFERGIHPDLLVGSSIGAVNAVGLAMQGINLQGIAELEEMWHQVVNAQLLDPRIPALILRAVIGRPSSSTRRKIEQFFISTGIDYQLTFGDLEPARLAVISADIETGQPVIYGQNPEQSVLEAVLSSIALPPWFSPIEKENHAMIDGGALSNLPIEPALNLGATEIYALDLDDDSTLAAIDYSSFARFVWKCIYAVSRRIVNLELALAEARGVPVYYLEFQGIAQQPVWDFSHYQEWIRAGYEKANQKLAEWEL